MTPTNEPLIYEQIQSFMSPTCFGVIYAILTENYTKILKLTKYNRLQNNLYYMSERCKIVFLYSHGVFVGVVNEPFNSIKTHGIYRV